MCSLARGHHLCLHLHTAFRKLNEAKAFKKPGLPCRIPLLLSAQVLLAVGSGGV